jgi:ribosome biogenesis GTPase / thiamine phosphate phosphatase
MRLEDWGWNRYFEAQWQSEPRGALAPARAISQQRGLWRIVDEQGESWAEAAGELRLAADRRALWPAVGDWLAVSLDRGSDRARIHGVLPRRSAFSRKEAGKRTQQQVLAANIDVALVVCGLDDDFNLRRIERYLAQVWDCGAKPVLLLNKADRYEQGSRELASRLSAAESVAVGAEVLVLSAKTGSGLAQLQSRLMRGATCVLLGSSGVGKSSLLNALLGREAQRAGAVRESDSRGRHITTTRQLFALPGGALVIDTPGLRELQLWGSQQGIAQSFADIDVLAGACKFSDCRHADEPGCRVAAAIAEGTLDRARLENFRKLLREQEFLDRKMDPEAEQARKEKFKTLSREIRRLYRERGKTPYSV